MSTAEGVLQLVVFIIPILPIECRPLVPPSNAVLMSNAVLTVSVVASIAFLIAISVLLMMCFDCLHRPFFFRPAMPLHTPPPVIAGHHGGHFGGHHGGHHGGFGGHHGGVGGHHGGFGGHHGGFGGHHGGGHH